MPRLVIDTRYVRPGMTGVGYWTLGLAAAAVHAGSRQNWKVTALTLAEDLPLTRKDEEASERIEHAWERIEGLRRVPVAWDYENHVRSDVWFHAGGLASLLARLKTDVFFSPTPLAPLRSACPTIATILDFIAWRYPATYPVGFRRYIQFNARLAAKRAHALVALSESVKKDAQTCFALPARKIRVIHPGVDPEFRPVPEGQRVAVREAYGLPREPYFMWVGNFEPRKDLRTAVRAFEILRDALRPGGRNLSESSEVAQREIIRPSGGSASAPSLLVVGHQRVPGGKASAATLRGSTERANIHWFSNLPRGVLASALSGAAALVFTSRCEGFGMPLAEAMACGTPVIAARGPWVSEVVGDSGFVVTPGDAEALAAAMLRVWASSEIAGKLGREGIRQAARFSWPTAGESLIDLAERVAKSAS